MKLAAGFLKHVRNGNKVVKFGLFITKALSITNKNNIKHGQDNKINVTEAVDEPAILTNNLVKITTKSL